MRSTPFFIILYFCIILYRNVKSISIKTCMKSRNHLSQFYKGLTGRTSVCYLNKMCRKFQDMRSKNGEAAEEAVMP